MCILLMPRSGLNSSSTSAYATNGADGVISTNERLRFYRRCLHRVDEQILELQVSGATLLDDEVCLLQAEMTYLDELIKLITGIGSSLPHSPVNALSPAARIEAPVDRSDMFRRIKGTQNDAGTSLIPSRPKSSNPGSQWHGQSTQLPAENVPPFSSRHGEIKFLEGKKVLLVEDDIVNRSIGNRLLESLNCKVTVSCNGKEALDLLKLSSSSEDHAEGTTGEPLFDLVLMDLSMPVLDGTHAVRHIRDWEELQEPPRKPMLIFAVTSNVTDGDMVKCAQSGFDEFVDKPLTVDKLLDRLQNHRHKEARRSHSHG